MTMHSANDNGIPAHHINTIVALAMFAGYALGITTVALWLWVAA